MFERLKRLYESNRLGIDGLVNAVKRNLINEIDFYKISGIEYDEATGNKAGEGNKAPKEAYTNE